MKKKEILKRISRSLKRNRAEDFDKQAKNILKIIENAGMEPPKLYWGRISYREWEKKNKGFL